MNIELLIDGEKKIFNTPIVPMLAKRKYMAIMAETEKKAKEDEFYSQSYQDALDEEDELAGVLANVVFGGQFTVDQLYAGASDEYVYEKLHEAVFGKKAENQGNSQGK